jgi:hypothetical protein
MNGLAVAANDAADVALTQLHFEDRHLAARNFRQHHVVGKFDELSNNELEKFLHVDSGEGGASAGGGGGASAGAAAGAVSTGAGAGAGLDAAAAAAFFAAVAASFFAAASGFLVFLIKLRTVSDGCAPLLIQCSIRSSFRVLFCPAFFGS